MTQSTYTTQTNRKQRQAIETTDDRILEHLLALKLERVAFRPLEPPR